MEVIQYQLENGMNVILHPNNSAPVVACNVWVGVGSADETAKEAGLAHVHEHMLFKGTETRGVGQIAQEVEASGGHINAFTSFEQTCYYVVMSSRFFDNGLDILADAIQRSSFDADELERELEVIQEELKRSLDNPHRQATQKLFETAYKSHPYRLPIIGTKESIDSFRREDVVHFYKKHYVPSNMTLVLAGDFEEQEARAKVDAYFGKFSGTPKTEIERSEEGPQSECRVAVVPEGRQDTHLRISFHIPKATEDDIPALELLSMIMGQGEVSRLHHKVQREAQLVNMVYSATYTLMDHGLFFVAADYQLRDEEEEIGATSHQEVIEAVLAQVFGFFDQPLHPAEVQRARTLLESQAIYSKQTIEGLAMKFGHYAMITGDPTYEEKYYARLAEVDVDELRAVATKYLHPDNCTVVVSHPPEVDAVAADEVERVVREVFAASREDVDIHEIEVEGGPLGGEDQAELAASVAFETDEDGFTFVTLDNGLKLIIQENRAVELFSIRALTYGGLRSETSETNGVSAMLSELITRGTSQFDAMQLASITESMASSIGGISGRNTTGMAATGLSRYFDPCLSLFAQCFFDAQIPEDELAREVRLHLQELKSRSDQLGVVTYERFARAFFQQHPYALPSQGTEESIKGLTTETVRAHMRRVLHPSYMTMAIVGDVDAAQVVAKVEKLFGQQKAQTEGVGALKFDAPTRASAPQLLVGDLDKNQAHVLVGLQAPTIRDGERHALEVLQSVLSGQGGRLFMELRDKQSLAYSVYASSLMGIESSAFMVNIGTSPEKIEQAVGGIHQELLKLREGGVTQRELEDAKRYLIGNHDIGLQRNSSRAMSISLDELYGNGYKNTFAYGDQIEAVDLDAIQALIEKYLDPASAIVSITKPTDVEVREDILADWKS